MGKMTDPRQDNNKKYNKKLHTSHRKLYTKGINSQKYFLIAYFWSNVQNLKE